jgi:hypothetical protein
MRCRSSRRGGGGLGAFLGDERVVLARHLARVARVRVHTARARENEPVRHAVGAARVELRCHALATPDPSPLACGRHTDRFSRLRPSSRS